MTFQKWNWNTIQPQLGLGRAIINVDTVFCFQLQARILILFLISFIAPYESQSSSDYKCESVSSECNRSVIIQPKFIKLTSTAAKPVSTGGFQLWIWRHFSDRAVCLSLSVWLLCCCCYQSRAGCAACGYRAARDDPAGIPAQPSPAQLKIRSVIILSPAR